MELLLSDEEAAFAREQVDAGVYNSVDDVVRAGLRLLRSKEGRHAELQRLINEGLDDVANGRVHEYATTEDFVSDIKRLAALKRGKAGAGN